jgi:hypothetical protein
VICTLSTSLCILPFSVSLLLPSSPLSFPITDSGIFQHTRHTYLMSFALVVPFIGKIFSVRKADFHGTSSNSLCPALLILLTLL